jgi:hypothetical protein
MRAKKQSKSKKGLKAAKKLEKQKPLITVPLTDVHVTGHTLGSGGSGGGSN